MSLVDEQQEIDRREFLKRTAKAGVAITAACSLSGWLYDKHGPQAARRNRDLVQLPDFSIPALEGQMSIVTGSDRVRSLNRGLEALGGIEKFIKKGDRVLLKVNAAFATPPMLCATTNPELVAELVRLSYKSGAISVIVTDNPINDPESCFALSGISDAARSLGAKVMLPRDSYFLPTTIPEARLIRNWPILWEPFQGINKVIGVAPIKDHHRSGGSMIMKNWYGLLGGRRNIFHQDIHTIIKELAMMILPTLVVLDGTTSMMSNGPTGGSLADLKDTHTMIISSDQVASDAFGASILGKTLAELPYITKAEEAGLGTTDYESLNPKRVNVA